MELYERRVLNVLFLFGTLVMPGPGYDYVGEEFSGSKIAIKQQRNKSAWRGVVARLNQREKLGRSQREGEKIRKGYQKGNRQA